MPRQMPRNGRPERAASSTTSRSVVPFSVGRVRFAIAAPKAPTPGRITFSAAWIAAGSAVTSAA